MGRFDGHGDQLRRGAVVTIAVAALVGYLLQSGAMDPVVADVVTALTPDEPTGRADEPRLQRVADWTDVPEWSPKRGVPTAPARPQAAAPAPPREPAIAPPENPRPWMRVGVPRARATFRLEPMHSCPQYHGPSATMPMQVTPQKSAVTATWWSIGDPDVISFRVVASAKATGERTEISVPAVTGCQTMTATVAGLVSGARYQIFLETVNESRVQAGRTYRVMRAQSELVVVT